MYLIHGIFSKTIIIRQLRKWNESKIVKNRWDFCEFLRVVVIVWVCGYACVG